MVSFCRYNEKDNEEKQNNYIDYTYGICCARLCSARKFEEVAEKQEVCAKELKTLKTLKTELETENTELKSVSDLISQEAKRLRSDTTLLESLLG